MILQEILKRDNANFTSILNTLNADIKRLTDILKAYNYPIKINFKGCEIEIKEVAEVKEFKFIYQGYFIPFQVKNISHEFEIKGKKFKTLGREEILNLSNMWVELEKEITEKIEKNLETIDFLKGGDQ